MKFLLLPPVLLAISTVLISVGLWFVYRPLVAIYPGIIFGLVAYGLATAVPPK